MYSRFEMLGSPHVPVGMLVFLLVEVEIGLMAVPILGTKLAVVVAGATAFASEDTAMSSRLGDPIVAMDSGGV